MSSDWEDIEGELWGAWDACGKPASYSAMEEWIANARRQDRVRVLGYLEILRRRRVDAAKRLEGALTIANRAPSIARIALDTLHAALDEEEAFALMVASNDAGEFARWSQALETLET